VFEPFQIGADLSIAILRSQSCFFGKVQKIVRLLIEG